MAENMYEKDDFGTPLEGITGLSYVYISVRVNRSPIDYPDQQELTVTY